MKHSLSVLCLFVLSAFIFISSKSVSGQRKSISRKPRPSTDSVSKVADPRLIPPPIREFSHSYKVEYEYDKFKNESSVTLDMPLEPETGNNLFSAPSPLSIYVTFSFKGQKLTAFPAKIFFVIKKNVWMSIQQVFPKPTNPSLLTVLADNDRLKYSVFTQRKLEQMPFRSDYYYSDDFAAFLPYKDFLRIVNSNNVEMNVSYLDDLKLERNHLEALRDFASQTNPHPENQSVEEKPLERFPKENKFKINPVGIWILKDANPSNKDLDMTLKIYQEGVGNYKGIVQTQNKQLPLNDFNYDGNSFSFTLPFVPADLTFFSSIQVEGTIRNNQISGNFVLNHKSGTDTNIRLTGFRKSQ